MNTTRNFLARIITNSFQSVHRHFSNSSDGSRLNTALISKQTTSLSVLFIPFSLFTYSLPCMLIIPLAPSGCPTPICPPFYSSALHSAPAALVLQALKFGTLYSIFPNLHLPRYFPPSSKTHLFQLALQSPSLLPSCALDSPSADHCVRLQIIFTYLLTYTISVVSGNGSGLEMKLLIKWE